MRDLRELLSFSNSSVGNSSSLFVTASARSRESLVNLRQQLDFMFALNFHERDLRTHWSLLKGNFFLL